MKLNLNTAAERESVKDLSRNFQEKFLQRTLSTILYWDIMIGVRLHGPLQEAIENALKFGALSDEDVRALETALAARCVGPSALKVVKIVLSNKGNDLMSILRGSELIFPQLCMKKVEQVSIDYSKRMKYLQRKDEERQYNEMVYGSVDAPGDNGSTGGDIGKQFSALQNQVSVLVNMVVATLSAFGIGYYFGTYFSLNSSQSMVLGVGVATVVMIIEMTLFILRASQMKS